MIVCNVKLLNVIFIDIVLPSENLGWGMQIHFTLIRNLYMSYESVRRGSISLVITLYFQFGISKQYFLIYTYIAKAVVFEIHQPFCIIPHFTFIAALIEGGKNCSAQLIVILSAIILNVKKKIGSSSYSRVGKLIDTFPN